MVFLGTPEAAVPTLEALAAEHEVALVVTQPDRGRGRSKRPVAPPIKDSAEGLGLEVTQPESTGELEAAIRAVRPVDVGVVVAYGRILRREVLELPSHGYLNVHFSLLPRWRGAAPVARALIAGDPMTGVTIMKLDEGLDTGPVLTAQAVDILRDENAGALTGRLARLGARLLTGVIDPFLSGEVVPVPQTDEGLIYADKIEASDRPIDVSRDVAAAIHQVRGLAPSPGATLDIDGAAHKVLAVRASEGRPDQGRWEVIDGVPVVGLSDGGLELVTLQPPGRTMQSGGDWVRGRREVSGNAGVRS